MSSMTKKDKVLAKVFESTDVKSVTFSELKSALKAKGFHHDRSNGDHDIWINIGRDMTLNIQPRKNDKKMSKPYQVRQLRELLSAKN
jgi:hypothetical protein